MVQSYVIGYGIIGLALFVYGRFAFDRRKEKAWLPVIGSTRTNLFGLDAYLYFVWWHHALVCIFQATLIVLGGLNIWTFVPLNVLLSIHLQNDRRLHWARILAPDPYKVPGVAAEPHYTHQLGCQLRVGSRKVAGLLLLAQGRFRFHPVTEGKPKDRLAPVSGGGEVVGQWVSPTSFQLTWPEGVARFEVPVDPALVHSLVPLEEFFEVPVAEGLLRTA